MREYKRQYNSVVTFDKYMNVIDDKVIKDNEEVIIRSKKKVRTPQQIHFLNQSNEFKKHCDSLGGYIHMIYCKNEILFNNVDIDKANISRIIYLATYIDYNNRKEGLLCVRSQHNKLEHMDKKTMQSVLKLGDTAFKKFIKDMKDNNLIYEVDKRFYINTEYFNKGNIEDMENNKSYCRLFIEPIRSLYEGCKVTKHKVLASIYQLIPYIHYANNIICHNPFVLESEAIPMNLKDIGSTLGIEDNKGNINKLVKELKDFRVNIEGVDIKVFNYVRLDDMDFYVVNPYVIYSGNNIKQLREVADMYFFRKQ